MRGRGEVGGAVCPAVSILAPVGQRGPWAQMCFAWLPRALRVVKLMQPLPLCCPASLSCAEAPEAAPAKGPAGRGRSGCAEPCWDPRYLWSAWGRGQERGQSPAPVGAVRAGPFVPVSRDGLWRAWSSTSRRVSVAAAPGRY